MAHIASFIGHVIPEGDATAVFNWGVDTNYGSSVPAIQNPITGIESVEVTSDSTELLPSTTYHAQMVVTNADGPTESDDVTFTTPADDLGKPIIVDFSETTT